ncbi:hypothetical protein [Rhodovibrio salinarum]|uniref:Uncharacterized protein n=1 Tax=Rhodovibrio salinarum TaxID=1087 RepID=A0A934QFW9_9PROT|nr:hypothetical protein [Rhodovibrio salinarum]MBK1696248.1 hypothetical protein [Rhodovibrio salinarum]
MAGWPSQLATAITLTAIAIAVRFASRSTRLHARGKSAGIGGHPVLVVFGSGMVLLVIYVALGAAAVATQWMVLMIAFMIATLIGFFLAAFYGGLLIASMVNARSQYRPAVETVEKGFTPSLVLGDFTGNGIGIVDADRRMLFVSGTICGFDEVSSMHTENARNLAKIRVSLTSGTTPVKTIGYQNQGQRDQDFQRLSNALGMR